MLLFVFLSVDPKALGVFCVVMSTCRQLYHYLQDCLIRANGRLVTTLNVVFIRNIWQVKNQWKNPGVNIQFLTK